MNGDIQKDCPLVMKDRRFGLSSHQAPCFTLESKEVQKYWGKPDSIERLTVNKEIWTYNGSRFKWGGVFLFVIWFPLPLFLPIGNESISFIIEDGYVSSATKHSTEVHMVGCYFVPGHGSLFGYEGGSFRPLQDYTQEAIATSNLYIETTPENANIEFKEIDSQFSQGMVLDSGKYALKISTPGYWPREFRITLLPWEPKTLHIKLNNEVNPHGEEISNPYGMNFIYVKPGSFKMGSPKDDIGRCDDEVMHDVTMTYGYYIQATKITKNQWLAVTKAHAELTGSPASITDSEFMNDFPMDFALGEAQDFVKALNELEGVGMYRLPTEAEWEYACRAGSTTRFNWGDLSDSSKANYSNRPMPVQSFPPNAWGFFDMHGNMFEWCQDWYGSYSEDSVIDPKGPVTGKYRVIRSGKISSESDCCRSASRHYYLPGYRYEKEDNEPKIKQIDYYEIGLRLVKEAAPKSKSALANTTSLTQTPD